MPRYILQEKLILDDHGRPWAELSDANLLAPSSLDVACFASAHPRRIFWSGWLSDAGDPESATDPRAVPRAFHTWSKTAWFLLDRWCDAALPHLDRADSIAILRPHHRHILSDPQSCLTFLKRREGSPRFQLLLDPASFLTSEMLPRAEDHLARAMLLVNNPAVAAILITNLTRAEHDPDTLLPARQGLIPDKLLSHLTSQLLTDKPLITL